MYGNQMEMAFMQDGGLKDQGGTKDKVSGNDVPSGSLKKEVRDDIPAMVSEGEFIFPADVVRYHGLDKLMQMRQEAKMGLNMMEKMGQMGNSEEAELPDDLPFTVADITVIEEDDAKMNRGGILFAQEGANIDYIPGVIDPQEERAKQERAAFSDFMGNTGYEPKGPRKYKLKNGDIIEIVHNYRDIPTQIVPEGAVLLPLDDTTPVTPKEGEEGEQAKVAPKKKEKTAAERQAKADATAARNKEAIETSAKRLGMTYDEYNDLGFGSRLALMGLELKGARGETGTAEERNAAIEKSKEGGAFGGLLGGLGAGLEKFLGKIGFDVDGDGNPFSSSRIKNPKTGEWEDPITNKVTNKADGTEVTEDEIKKPYSDPMYEEEGRGGTRPDTSVPYDPSEFAGSKPKVDPKNFGMPDPSEVPVTEPSFVQGMKDADRVAGTPISTGVGSADPSKDLMFMGTGPAPDVTTDSPVSKQTSDARGAAPTAVIKADTEPTIKQPVDMQTQNAFSPDAYVRPAEPVKYYKQPSFAEEMEAQKNREASLSAPATPVEAATVESTAKDLEQTTKEADEALELQSNQEKQQTKLDTINEGIKKLEGSLLSSSDKAKTQTRKDKIDEALRKKRADKRRKERDKQTAKERGKSYVKARSNIEKSKAKDVYKGGGKYGGFKKGGLMKRNYP